MTDFTVQTILEINKSIYKELPQSRNDGKQYFSIKNKELFNQLNKI